MIQIKRIIYLTERVLIMLLLLFVVLYPVRNVIENK